MKKDMKFQYLKELVTPILQYVAVTKNFVRVHQDWNPDPNEYLQNYETAHQF